MTDWGAVSSWVAAGISVTAFGAGTVRAWWSRPRVDWALTGRMGWPNYQNPQASWLEGTATFSNFGDGDAHRVSVHIHRGNAPMTQIIATHPLLKPGDKLDFELGCGAQHWDNTHVWVTWTPAPIRRHREKTSPRLPISEHLDQSEIMRGKLKKMAEEKRDEGSDF